MSRNHPFDETPALVAVCKQSDRVVAVTRSAVTDAVIFVAEVTDQAGYRSSTYWKVPAVVEPPVVIDVSDDAHVVTADVERWFTLHMAVADHDEWLIARLGLIAGDPMLEVRRHAA